MATFKVSDPSAYEGCLGFLGRLGMGEPGFGMVTRTAAGLFAMLDGFLGVADRFGQMILGEGKPGAKRIAAASPIVSAKFLRFISCVSKPLFLWMLYSMRRRLDRICFYDNAPGGASF